ncbi:DUF1289 domain-containing protein [Cohaesibacter celericrescens]|uniref:DUF1289 domain-containing protein n=1 Tax=Cohaesibacter celericrescens TaxID=2067669 RepID=A0A2N5XQI3_9HYPH|nr:DUF1289 domain-containing protein [Cohaesibacter celericrescens]PLW76782.1 DUF1289 domain-containing protein [Cohaesibacter celericrescens]
MAVKSPCIQVCTIDKKSDLCYGCARSLDEIRDWGMMSDSEQEAIVAQIDERMLVHFGVNRVKKPA